MDVLLGLLGAVSEGSEFVEALQMEDVGSALLQGIDTAVAINEVRHSYKKFQNSKSSLSSSSSHSASSLTAPTSMSSSMSSLKEKPSVTNGTSTVEVKWSDQSLKTKIGVIHVPEQYLVKCHESELFLVDDVVRATHDLRYATGERVSAGTNGVLKGYDKKGDMIVHWLVDGMRKLPGTPSRYIKKCDQRKFFKVGDVVQATLDLRYATGINKSLVRKGSNGTLQRLGDDGSWIVDWWNGITGVSTKQKYLLKCDQAKFFKVGEVIKVKYDLIWPSGEAVPAGTFGKLTRWDMTSNNWDVHWWNDVGVLGVTQGLIQKCHHTEYSLPKDVLKTTCDLSFGELGTVPKGSLCMRVYNTEQIEV